ncbi:MAG: ATP-dependent helicase/nuclease subunit [Planctomycetota bacterium]
MTPRPRSIRVLDATKPLSEAMCDLLLDDPGTDSSQEATRFDFSEVLVLVPGRALVRSLEHALLGRSRAGGAPLVSPTFVTPARLASLVVDPFESTAAHARPSAPAAMPAVGALLSETAERLLWRRVLERSFGEDRAAIEAVFGPGLATPSEGRSPGVAPATTLDPRAIPILVERLMRLSREAFGACGDLASIARRIGRIADAADGGADPDAATGLGPLPDGDAARVIARWLVDRWGTLARLEARFADEASSDGTVRASREAAVARALAEGAVLSAGFRRVVVLLADPEPVHRAVLRALESRGVVVEICVHRPFGAGSDELDREGFPVVEHWSRRAFPESVLPSASILCAGTPAEQAGQAVHAIARIAPPRRSDRIALVAGDGSTRRRLECELVERGVVLASASERPFAETRLGQLLVRIGRLLDARAAGRPSLEAFAAFIRHPDVVARLSAEGVEGGVDDVSRYRATCASESIDDRVPDALARHDAFAGYERLRRWTIGLLDAGLAPDACQPAKAWAPGIRALLERIVGTGAEEDGVRVVDERRRAVRALDEALAELAAVPDACTADTTLAETIALVLARLGSSVVRDQAGTDGVPILGWLDAGIADEPDLVVVGMNEGVVPGSAGGDPLLPEALREALGVPSSRRRAARDAWILDGMLVRRSCGRGSVAFVVGRQDAAGDPLRPSRFLLSPGRGGEELARRVLLLTGEATTATSPPGEAGVAVPSARDRDATAQALSPLVFPITPEIAEPRIESVSVTGFARYMKCPYLFLLERDPRLRLRSDDEDALELDPLAFGNLVHGALETWGRTEAARPDPTTDEARIREEVLDALADHVRRHFGRRLAPAVEVQIELARRRLGRFASIQAREADAGWKVAFVELAFTAPKGVPTHDTAVVRLAVGEEGREPLEGAIGATGTPTVHPAIRIGRSPDGRRLLVTGRIDRVDRHADGRYRALDYKSSASGEGPAAVHLKGRGALEKRQWKDLQLPLYRRLLASVGIDVGSRLGYVVLAPKLAQCRVAMLEMQGRTIDPSKLDEADAKADEIADAILSGEFVPAGGRRGATCPVRADDPMAAIWGKGYRGLDAALDGDFGGGDGLDDEGDDDGGGDRAMSAASAGGERKVAP